MNALHETVERGAQEAEFIVVLDSEAFGQVALTVSNVGHGAGHDVQRLYQDADQHAQQGNDDRNCDDGRNDRRGAEIAELREGFVLIHRQTDVPVDGRQAFDRGESDDAGFAIDFHFTEIAADARCIFRVRLSQGFHHQRFVRVHQDLAIGADQERITHAIEVQRIQAVGDYLQAQVTTDHTDVLAVLEHTVDDGDDQLARGQIDVGFGQRRATGALGAFVPRAGARIIAIRHFAVRADDEGAILVANVSTHEGRRHRLLLQQLGDVADVRVQRGVLCEVFDQQTAPGQPGLDIVGSHAAHFLQILVQVLANGVAL
ncbi:hypothetical protein D3C84_681760 [compost metagenome]